MLFVINPNDFIHTKNYKDRTVNPMLEYYVLDTDDLSVERVTGRQLIYYHYHVVGVSNLIRASGSSVFLVEFFCVFGSYVTVDGARDLSCLNGRLVIKSRDSFVLDNILYELKARHSDRMVQILLDDILLVSYESEVYVQSCDIMYMYMLSDNFVIRVVMTASVFKILLTIILDNSGKVVGVLSDECFAPHLHIEPDAFVAKYLTLVERKY